MLKIARTLGSADILEYLGLSISMWESFHSEPKSESNFLGLNWHSITFATFYCLKRVIGPAQIPCRSDYTRVWILGHVDHLWKLATTFNFLQYVFKKKSIFLGTLEVSLYLRIFFSLVLFWIWSTYFRSEYWSLSVVSFRFFYLNSFSYISYIYLRMFNLSWYHVILYYNHVVLYGYF